MPLHHLDPRQAGQGQPDVETKREHGAWFARWYNGIAELLECDGATEAAALHAARVAAGFGHVAEKPCEVFMPHCDDNPCAVTNCMECAWPRDRHA